MDILEAIVEKQKIINEYRETDRNKIVPKLKSLTNKFINTFKTFEPSFNNIYYLEEITNQFLYLRYKDNFGLWRYIVRDNVLYISSKERTPRKISQSNNLLLNSKIVGGNKAQAKLRFVKDGGKIEYTSMNDEMKRDCICTLLKEYLLDPFFCISIDRKNKQPIVYKELCNLI